MANILWMDNDPGPYLRPFISRLEFEGHKVHHVRTLSGAEALLSAPGTALPAGESWRIVLIDVMMWVSREETDAYPPGETEHGLTAGVLFYKRNRNRIAEIGAQPVVYTRHGEPEVREAFLAAGLPSSHYANRTELSDTADFWNWIRPILYEKNHDE